MLNPPARQAWRPLSECAGDQSSGPFPFGYVDDYLPEDLLAELQSTFPDPDRHELVQVLGKGKKRVVFRAPPVPEFVSAAGPEWAEAVTAVCSPHFLEPTWEWVRGRLAATPVHSEAYQELLEQRLALSVDDLIVQMEFSSLEAGAYLPPHTDAADKVLSCVFYLPVEGWDPTWGGVSEVYTPARVMGPNWHNRIGEREWFTVLDAVPYTPNRMFWFIKTEKSWHGVSPVTAPPGIGRWSFNVSLAIRPETLKRPGLAGALSKVA